MKVGRQKMDRMNVATALNKKYLLYTGVMLHSLCKNNNVPVRAFLLHSELKECDIQYLREALADFDVEIVPLKVNTGLFSERLPRNLTWSIETYYRLALLELLPEDVERLLYIDVDIIVNKSLGEVYALEFEDDEIIATEDSCGKTTWDKFGDKQKEMFAPMIEQGYIYFNAGFMLLNIAKMREKYSFETYMQAIEEWNYQMDAPDQDILNYVHWKYVGYIDCWEYDLFARIAHNEGLTYEDVKQGATVIHYAGTKPWDGNSCHYDIEQLWWDYAKETPFYVQLMEEFLHKTMFDRTLENYINDILRQTESTQEQLSESVALNQRLLNMIRGGK